LKLHLVRHGETTHNLDGIVQGRIDLPLSDSGRQQASVLAACLSAEPVEAVYSSPLKRARETAEILSSRLCVPVVEEAGLIEMDIGDLDGLTLAEVRERYGEFLTVWRRDESATMPLPGGESLSDVQQRAWAAVERIAAAHQAGGGVILVSHQFTLQTVLCRVIGAPLINFERFRFDPAKATTVEIAQRRMHVEKFNVRCESGTE
jgi:broad specificity phosphatase PhoE